MVRCTKKYAARCTWQFFGEAGQNPALVRNRRCRACPLVTSRDTENRQGVHIRRDTRWDSDGRGPVRSSVFRVSLGRKPNDRQPHRCIGRAGHGADRCHTDPLGDCRSHHARLAPTDGSRPSRCLLAGRATPAQRVDPVLDVAGLPGPDGHRQHRDRPGQRRRRSHEGRRRPYLPRRTGGCVCDGERHGRARPARAPHPRRPCPRRIPDVVRGRESGLPAPCHPAINRVRCRAVRGAGRDL